MAGRMTEIRQFNEFMTSQRYSHKVVIAGNHDIVFDDENSESLYPYWRGSVGGKLGAKEAKELLEDAKCTYLQDSEVTINGIRIYGSPWVPVFGNMAFMLPRGQELKEKWDQIPEGIDVLVTHGPPLGYGDLCISRARAGCIHLLDAVQHRVKPKYHVFGHIHEGYGILTNDVTTFINASIATVRYMPENKPIVFDLPNK
ncbi:hypothetical protein QZH41_004388 [Actinostola sp. cb2023]|nr:hypothetical protein QZH41_004388 [Actinostola sp. cb2023]